MPLMLEIGEVHTSEWIKSNGFETVESDLKKWKFDCFANLKSRTRMH